MIWYLIPIALALIWLFKEQLNTYIWKKIYDKMVLNMTSTQEDMAPLMQKISENIQNPIEDEVDDVDENPSNPRKNTIQEDMYKQLLSGAVNLSENDQQNIMNVMTKLEEQVQRMFRNGSIDALARDKFPSLTTA